MPQARHSGGGGCAMGTVLPVLGARAKVRRGVWAMLMHLVGMVGAHGVRTATVLFGRVSRNRGSVGLIT